MRLPNISAYSFYSLFIIYKSNKYLISFIKKVFYLK